MPRFLLAVMIMPCLFGSLVPVAQAKITLISTGDIIPARTVNATMVRRNDFFYPFAKTAKLLKLADILFINLEAPLLADCPVTDTGMVFCGSNRFAESLEKVGVDVVSLANNHSGNYGASGLVQTKNLLEAKRIRVTGLGKPIIIKVKGKRFGFLAYNDIEKNRYLNIALANKKSITKDVRTLKKEVDYVVVAFHWGDEYTHHPNNRQQTLARLAVDNGADLVVGNHPHWIQSTEYYKGKLINYALGNFIFDQMWSMETRYGLIARYVFDGKKKVKVSYAPVVIENYSQPRPASPEEATIILKPVISGIGQKKPPTGPWPY